jgi:hypothetical protein
VESVETAVAAVDGLAVKGSGRVIEQTTDGGGAVC